MAGSKLANDSEHLEPKTAASACEASSLTVADVLAREPSAQDVDRLQGAATTVVVGVAVFSVDPSYLPDIFEPFRVGPMLREHAPTPWIDLDLPEHGAEASALQAELEATDAGE